jgi:hypothetical protein
VRGNSHARFGKRPRGNDPSEGTAPRGLLHAHPASSAGRPAVGPRPGTRRRGRGHGRTVSRSVKVIDLGGTDAHGLFPHAHRAIKVVRRRRLGAHRPSVEIVYAITSLDYRAADPRLLADWLQGHWAIENCLHW